MDGRTNQPTSQAAQVKGNFRSASSTELFTAGIHHITAMASDPQTNLDFYVKVIGLRLVKRTVNFDDPESYHFYFADAAGHPGTVLTFFPSPNAKRGVQGSGSVLATAFAVPRRSLAWWKTRLAGAKAPVADETQRFGSGVLTFEDPDGLRLELVESDVDPAITPVAGPEIASSAAIVGFHSATLAVRSAGRTIELLTKHFGYTASGTDGTRTRLIVRGHGSVPGVVPVGSILDVLEAPEMSASQLGAGIVHHIALRAVDDGQQGRWQTALHAAGFGVTEQRDRHYFRSVYFRERGGVLFEIATDGPGFAIDEPAEAMGMGLMLPAQFESARAHLAAHLPPIVVPVPEHPVLGSHVHRWLPASDRTPATPTLVLLHGTGGDENDLIGLAQRLAPEASILSPRGNVFEGTQARFFRRLREGVFDLADVKRRSGELGEWLQAAQKQYGFTAPTSTVLGFSNGANIAAAMLLLGGSGQPAFTKAVLLRAMVTIEPDLLPDLCGVQVLLISGRDDPIVPVANASTLAAKLTEAGAEVDHRVLPTDHGLTKEDMDIAQFWLAAA